MGGRNLYLAVSALASVGAVQRHGVVVGLAVASLFGAFVWLVVWPLWLLTEAEPIANYVRRLPGWLVAVSWPVAGTWIWLLEPDHGVLVHRGPWLYVTLPVLWLIVLGMPMLTIRWFGARSGAAREGVVQQAVDTDGRKSPPPPPPPARS
jgi:hypothetical protein